MPNPYDLDFISNKSYLGVPFYHFTSNWTSVAGMFNFTKKSNSLATSPAKVGDRVQQWKNMYLSPGQGEAFVPKDSNGSTYFGDRGFPTLVEKTYGYKTYQGLKFTGTEHFQIDGATVVDAYSVPSTIFATNGASWAGNTGATFLFVIDQDYIDSNSVDPSANGIQSLLLSRQPEPTGAIPSPTMAAWPWPETEDLGIQYFRQGSSYNETSIFFSLQRWGPEATHAGGTEGIPFTKAPLDGYGGAADGDFDPFTGPTQVNSPRTQPGFQIILLEYNNEDQKKFVDSANTPTQSDRDYFGPTVKIYGMSSATGAWDYDGTGSTHFDTPKLVSPTPALRDWTLFHNKNAFLGGTPPARATSVNFEWGNGFRGIIYEVMMLEGVLTSEDRSRLEKILKRKYKAPLGL